MEVAGLPRSGSGVLEVRIHPGPKFLRGLNYGAEAPSVIGEAIAIDLGAQGALVMSLRSKGNFGPESLSFPGIIKTPQSEEEIISFFKEMSQIEASSDLPLERLWTVVSFSNPNDPDTLQVIDLNVISNYLNGTVKFRSAKIETTHDPVTTGIETELPWISHVRRGLPIGRSKSVLHSNFHLADFKEGIK